MYYLTNTGLFDDQHQNVVIVVTKAPIFWSDYDDSWTQVQKGQTVETGCEGKDMHKKTTVVVEKNGHLFFGYILVKYAPNDFIQVVDIS